MNRRSLYGWEYRKWCLAAGVANINYLEVDLVAYKPSIHRIDPPWRA